jgi:hypothetical protein
MSLYQYFRATPVYKKMTFLLAALLIVICGYTQRYPTTTIDLGSKTFTSKLSFDEPFLISGTAAADIVQVDFNYRLAHRKNWHYFPAKDSVDSITEFLKNPSNPWVRQGTETSFNVLCGALHPNTQYVFRFKVKKKFTLTEGETAKLKDLVREIVQQSFSAMPAIDNTIVEGFYTRVGAAVRQVKTGNYTELVLPDGSTFNFNQTATPAQLAKLLGSLTSSMNNITAFNNNVALTGAIGSVIDGGIHAAGWTTSVTNLITHLADLDANTKDLLNKPVDPGNAELKTLTGLDILKLLGGDLSSGHRFLDLIHGRWKIDGTTKNIVPVTVPYEIHKPTIDLIHAFFASAALQTFIVGTGNSAATHPVQPFITSLSGNFALFYDDYYRVYVPAADRLTLTIGMIPDLTVGLLLSTTYTVTDATDIEFVSSSTPYMGLDAGVGYTYNLNSYFAYYGFNFYLVPVNKNTRLRMYHGWDYLAKTISLYAGVTNNKIGPGNNNRYSASLGGSADLILGLGWRFNRGMRLNAGYQFYFLADPDPLVDRKKLSGSFVNSLTIDINILGGMTKLATALKIGN